MPIQKKETEMEVEMEMEMAEEEEEEERGCSKGVPSDAAACLPLHWKWTE